MTDRTPLEDLSVAIAQALHDQGCLEDNWQEDMTVSHRLSRERQVLKAASVVEWVIRTGKWKVEVQEDKQVDAK